MMFIKLKNPNVIWGFRMSLLLVLSLIKGLKLNYINLLQYLFCMNLLKQQLNLTFGNHEFSITTSDLDNIKR